MKLKEIKEITIKGLEPHIEGIVEVGCSAFCHLISLISDVLDVDTALKRYCAFKR